MTLFCYWRLNDLFCNERRSDGCSEDCRCYLMAQTTPTPENCPFPLRDLSPSNTWFRGPQFRSSNGISIGSAIFAQLTVECPITLHCAATSPPKKLPLPLRGSGPPSNTWYLRPTWVIIANGMSIGSAVLYGSQMLCCTMHCQWEEDPKTAPSPSDFVTLPENDRATAIDNMHRKIGKDRACRSGDILTDRQTHTDVLITILRHRSRGRINECMLWWYQSAHAENVANVSRVRFENHSRLL